ncbi:MAG: hypothetical protein ACP5PJ_01405 [Acidimicrobiales bacterium]
MVSSRRSVLTLIGVLGFVLTGCGLGAHNPSAAPRGRAKGSHPGSTTTSPASSSTTELVQGTTKPPLRGLLDMGVQSSYALGTPFPVVDLAPLSAAPGAFSGVVVNENWFQLEPGDNQFDWSSLDASLAAVTTWNLAHPADPLGVKLRIFAGRSAPS